MKRRWISSPRRSRSNWLLSTAEWIASVTSTKRTERWKAISGTPAAAHACSTGSGTRSRQVEPSSTATAAAPCSISDVIQRRWSRSCGPVPIPVVSTNSPPLSRSLGSAISITWAQRSSRSRPPAPAITSGRARRTTGNSRT